jgi:RND family efflux transporter MFP subunit
MHSTRFLALAVLSAGALAFAQSSSTQPFLSTPTAMATVETEGVGHTFPSDQAQQRLRGMGVVDEVLVKPGDRVKKGQVLLKEDHRVEDAQLKLYEYVANSDVEIKAAEAKNKQAKVECGRFEELFANGMAAAKIEVEKAKLEVELTQAEIDKARQEKEKAKLQVEYQRAVIQSMELRSAMDGIVERIDAKLGEVVDPQKNAITVVKNTPLWVEFRPKSSVAKEFQVGQELEVKYEGEKEMRRAKIIFISPMVDPQSDRHLVRLEMPNPENYPAGLKVSVHLPGKMAQVDAK